MLTLSRLLQSSSLDLATAVMYVDDIESAVLQMQESGFHDIFDAFIKAAKAAHAEMRMLQVDSFIAITCLRPALSTSGFRCSFIFWTA